MSGQNVSGLLSYAELRKRERSHPVLRDEVPMEHAVSLPIPTLQLGQAGYAAFAAPSWSAGPVVGDAGR
jgi:hypothetical protein